MIILKYLSSINYFQHHKLSQTNLHKKYSIPQFLPYPLLHTTRSKNLFPIKMGSCNGKDLKKTVRESESKLTSTLKITAQTFVNSSPLKITDVYKMCKSLGSGAFGEVRLVTHKHTGHERAVKIFRKSTYPSKREISKLQSEIEILRKLDHPNIIQIYEYFDDPKRFYIIMEKCEGGELYSQIVLQNSFTEQDAQRIIRQLVSAVSYLHSHKIVHRDIKPENILFEYSGDLSSIKLIDFGVASFFDESQRMKEPVGTFYYAAPEVMGKDYDSKCDMWSVGIISFLLLTGKPPFEQADDSVITEKVKALKFQDLEASLAAVSSEAADFIRQLIQPAESRASAEQALNHPWLAGSSPSTLRSVSADVIESLRKFHKGNKLQEAVRAYITSQCLTVQETKELKDLFKQIDSNGDGKISKEELQNYYLKVMGDNYDLTEVEKIMKEIDSDQSGFVDYSEFIKATVSNSVINNVKNLRLAFMKFDSDNSGKISADEFRAVLDSEFRYSENVWKQIVKIADKNNDGEIDFSEFMQVVLES